MPINRHGAGDKLYRRNRKRIIESQSICGICGRPVDKSLKAPDPMSPTVDHIIPVSKGGHLTDIHNLQLAHWICNRLKSDKLVTPVPKEDIRPGIRQSCDWKNF